jgi:hypothetical protein
MAEADEKQSEETKKAKPPDDAPSKGDIAAIGIGCLVFVLFFIAIVMVGATRE